MKLSQSKTMLHNRFQAVTRYMGEFFGQLEDYANKSNFDFPFGKEPLAEKQKYLALWKEEKANNYPTIDAYEEAMGAKIEPEWFHELALLTQVVIKPSKIIYQHGRILYSTIRNYLREHPDISQLNIIETGTARGFSALCMAAAIHDAQKCGTILTFDVLPHDVKMYWNCIADENGPLSREELLAKYSDLMSNYIIFHQGDAKRELKKVIVPRVHFAFLDAAHTYKQVSVEIGRIRNRQRAGDIIVFDDYTPSSFPGVVKAVDELCMTGDYKKDVITLSNERGYAVAIKN